MAGFPGPENGLAHPGLHRHSPFPGLPKGKRWGAAIAWSGICRSAHLFSTIFAV
jgi:hypothetical protein